MERFTVLINFILAMLYTTETAALPSCVNSCFGVLNGNYQYCHNCHQYVSCAFGFEFIMPCPDNLVWDDVLKKCHWVSSTCEPKSQIYTSDIESRKGCVKSCDDVRDGKYQYCPDCRQYVSCVHGNMYIIPCSYDKLWDDIEKKCVRISFTCTALGHDKHD